jgi:hypothetical protein
MRMQEATMLKRSVIHLSVSAVLVSSVAMAQYVHIPAQDEHAFWFNVNTDSGRT